MGIQVVNDVSAAQRTAGIMALGFLPQTFVPNIRKGEKHHREAFTSAIGESIQRDSELLQDEKRVVEQFNKVVGFETVDNPGGRL